MTNATVRDRRYKEGKIDFCGECFAKFLVRL
jgi:hypothetical protein